MTKGRLEAFSDGVLAILITIMVLELKVPHGSSLHDLLPLWPVFLSYLLSFIYLGIYWNNHHHMLHAATRINGATLWANMHLLFWLSLVPFVTEWMGDNEFAAMPTAAYGVVLLLAALAYWILQNVLIRENGRDSTLARAVGRHDWKGNISPLLYIAGIGLTFVHPAIGGGLYLLVALIWLIPDRRIERELTQREGAK
jgi:uncharacterized membrane protein